MMQPYIIKRNCKVKKKKEHTKQKLSVLLPYQNCFILSRSLPSACLYVTSTKL